MQQTEKYELNIVETGDPLGPEPFNENARKLETALWDQAPVIGTYTGNGTGQEIDLGFKPRLVLLVGVSYSKPSIAILTETRLYYNTSGVSGASGSLKLTERGFQCTGELCHNKAGETEWYLAVR